jgi:hypothetical protein
VVRIKDVIKREKHLSRFLLTINTQQAGYPIYQLKDAMNGIYENLELFLKIKLNNKWIIYSDYLIDNPNSKLINLDETVIKPQIKVGKKFHKVHSHSLISIPHDTIVQLDRISIEKYLEKMLDLKGLHINIRYIKDNSFTLKKYLEKDL